MAIPVPRSYPAIVGDAVDAFLSRYPVRGIKVGGPILAFIEATSQSAMRNSQDIFALLDAGSLERAKGVTLDRIAKDEDTERHPSTTSSGLCDFSDSTFTKISTRIYSGAAAPNAGTTLLKIVDGSDLTSTGSVYLGRGTTNYEGPIAYTSPTQVGGYWTITLTTPTQQIHDVNETVILARGGARIIPAGQLVQSPQGNVSVAVGFNTVYAATIEDGETSVEDVSVVCKTPGVTGNVLAGSISEVVGTPFTGCGVTNPLPYSNGHPIEGDPALRERIRNLRKSRALGTRTALITYAQGVRASDENKTVLSANVVSPNGEPTTLYIDDGSGYEEVDEGVALESLMDQALGGEQYFELEASSPVAKAFAQTTLTTPFELVDGATLAVEVAGTLTSHTFDSSAFRSIENATAYEVVSAINGDSELDFSARTAAGGTKVVIFSRTDTNEEIEVVEPDSGVDANTLLGFPIGVNYTLRLYKNDVLLYKDGRSAIVTSASQSSWDSSIATGVQLRIKIDQTPAMTYTFANADFVSADTGYTTVSPSNSLESWAEVFNTKVPGLTATYAGGRLILTSNRGASDDAGIVLTEPTGVTNNLIELGMFTDSQTTSVGKNRDYTLDRNTSQLKLTVPLTEGDSLSAGTEFTRAYLQSESIGASLTIATGGATVWCVVDGAAELLSTGITGATTITVSSQTNNRVRYTAGANDTFGVTGDPYIQAGDYVIIWDGNLNARGTWRVSALDTTNFAWFEIERDLAEAQSATVLASLGITFVRTVGEVQCLRVAAGASRTLQSICDDLNDSLVGAVASVYRNSYIRLTTNTYGDNGDVFVAVADEEGRNLLFTEDELSVNSSSHVAAVESGNSELGTPNFNFGSLSALSTGIGFTSSPVPSSSLITTGQLIAWAQRPPAATYFTYGSNVGDSRPVYSIASNVTTPRVFEPQYALAVGGLVRVGTTVTGTVAGGHTLADGDIIRVWPGEADFAVGAKTITAVTATTFTYTEAGAPGPSTLIQNVVHSQSYLASDQFWGANPYAMCGDDVLNVALDSDISKIYALPMGRHVKPDAGATYAQTGFELLDADNNDEDLSVAFSDDDEDFFRDFAVFMHARGKSHSVGSNKAILWRYARFGAEGNAVRVAYVHPEAPSQPITLTPANGQYAILEVALPSGAARTGLNLTNTTRFTASVTNALNANAVSVDTIRYTYSKPTIAIGGLVRASNIVTATTATAHGYSVGDVVYLTSTDPEFVGGAKTVASVPGATSFTYHDAGDTLASTVATSVSSASVDATFAGLTVGDIANFSTDTGLASTHTGPWRVSAKAATYFEVKWLGGVVSAITTPFSIVNSSNLQFYPIDTAISKASDIVTWITANAADVVTAVAVENGGGSPGTGTIDTTTLDEYLNATNNATGPTCVDAWSLADGVNFVQASDLSASPCTVNLKNAVSADLTANADLANEDIRLVPVTADGIARYLSNSAVGGVYASSEIATTSRAGKVQIASNRAGSTGAVQVTGGSANSATANVVGAGGVVDTTYSKVTALTSQTTGLTGNAWCAIQASHAMQKTTAWTAITIANYAASQWLVTLAGGAWTLIQSIVGTGVDDDTTTVRIQKAGRFAAYTLSATYPISGVSEGCWVDIQLSDASSANTGVMQVVRVSSDGQTIWVENEDAVTESVFLDASPGSFFFYSFNSAMPGDTLVIDTDQFGTSNRGSFAILDHGPLATQVIVSGDLTAQSLTSLGVYSTYVRLMEADPTRLIKQIHTIGQNPDDDTYSDIIFTSDELASRASSTAGSSVQALDKLDFDTSIVNGADAYSYATGLIGEVTRVMYGDPANSSVYPGVVAAGANVNVSGPLVKRTQVSFAIRLRTGATASDVIARVRSTVASAINRVQLGQPVAISTLIAAAERVDGVAAVSVLSPSYSSSDDVISVQANEKPRVLDILQDVLVSIVGA